ncbi:DNA primase [Thermosediminibacter oceani]|uniref:DNA primase n=1 Tax=Thermosediminibacter oceani (strain ATCC BAA-1034 / DSM 16646 / JW/IW-1228P) TaxID=555079 RepID=D9S2R6_THEOJ|nr:DNA primase [Thermosediminibacter oceani]ADL07693.1 DNA primase [Thermosediminibacter oceani DSM 16646]
MSLYPEELIREVQNRADIVEIVSDYVSLKKRGENYVGLCPFHSEKTPSFTISPKKQLFYCFGCGTGGNIFSFLMKKENWTFPEAVRWLAERVGVRLPEEGTWGKVSEAFKQKREILEINRLAAEFFHQNLIKTAEGKRAREYLANRGITSETVEKFFLGYAPPRWDGLIRFMRSKGVRDDSLLKAGLVIPRSDGKGYYDRFRDRVIFPIKDITGNTVGFGGRILGEGEPKYLNSPETTVFTKREQLYGLPMIKKGGSNLILVEGYMDCISLHQNGFTQTVASLGTSLTEQQAKILKRYSEEVIIAYDADTAGQSATLRGIEILVKEGLKVRVLSLPEGKDPDEFIRTRGKDAFAEQLSSARNFVDYKLDLAGRGLDLKTRDGKIKFIKNAISVLAGIENRVERELYVQKLSEELNIPRQALYEEINKIIDRTTLPNIGSKYKNSQLRDNNKELTRFKALSGVRKAERDILRMMIEDDSARDKIMKNLTPNNFVDTKHRKIAEMIFEMVNRNEVVTPNGISIKLKDDQETAAELANILMETADIENSMVDALINRVKENYLKLAIKKIKNEINQAEKIGEVKKAFSLLNTYHRLKLEIEQLKRDSSRKGGT